MPGGAREQRTLAAVDAVEREYGPNVLPFTAEDAAICASLRAMAWGSGNNVAYQDRMISATALRTGFTVATRNVLDFEPLGVQVHNPFSKAAE